MKSTMEDDEKVTVNLLDEEATLRIYGEKLSIPNLVQSNKMYLLLVGLTENGIREEVQANYTTLNWVMDLENATVYLDYGFNRQKLTRALLNKLADLT